MSRGEGKRSRRIAVLTGSRADYGPLYAVLKAIEGHQRLDLALIVTGIHLEERWGMTVGEIEEDGFPIAARVKLLLEGDTGADMARALAEAITGITGALEELEPDLFLVAVDRFESLAGAIAGACMNIPVAHVHGGERSGSVDESFRHAISRLAHIHFVATQQSAERLIQMGEQRDRVHVVGAPGVDAVLHRETPPPRELAERYTFDLSRPLYLAVFHPVTTEAEDSGTQMEVFLSALDELGEQTVALFPNADAGGRQMIEVLEEYRQRSWLRVYPTLRHRDYLGLMKVAQLMVGNSSSGIIEAPSLGLPVVNVGNRQLGRERAANVLDVPCERDAIVRAAKRARTDGEFIEGVRCEGSPYGDGRAAERIVRVLAEVPITKTLLQKRLAG